MEEPLFVQHPEVGLLMARFIAGFSVTEVTISQVLSHFLGKQGHVVTDAIFHQIRNVSDRLQAFENLLKATPGEHAAELSDILAEAKRLNTYRNILAHGFWHMNTLEDPSHIAVMTWLTSNDRKTEIINMTIPHMRQKLDELIALNSRLFAVGRAVMIARWPSTVP